MAQADSSITTRRSFFHGALAAPFLPLMLAAPALALPTLAETTLSIDWAALEDQLFDCREEIAAAVVLRDQASEAIARWDTRNPFPNQCEHENTWQARRENALRNSRVGHKASDVKQATQRRDDLTKQIAKLPARTIGDLKAKARLARYYDEGPTRAALLRDIEQLHDQI